MRKARWFSLSPFLVCAVFTSPAVFSQESPRSAVTASCDDLNYQIKREGSPFHYDNPNEGCNVSLKLDGLPTKTGGGYASSGNDACGQIQGIASDLEGKLNERLQGALSQIGDVVSADEIESLAGEAGVDASSLTNAMRNGVDLGQTINPELTETLGSLATKDGREKLGDEVIEGAGQAAQESLQNQNQNQFGNTGQAATPGINGNTADGASSGDEDWSIFD